MAVSTWTEEDTKRALAIWSAYQTEHDVSARKGQAVGIEPVSGRVWFGATDKAIKEQMQAEGIDMPFYCFRVGYGYYLRKARRQQELTESTENPFPLSVSSVSSC